MIGPPRSFPIVSITLIVVKRFECVCFSVMDAANAWREGSRPSPAPQRTSAKEEKRVSAKIMLMMIYGLVLPIVIMKG
jgi:uncharacterized membrane protein YbjE (DUF340 family)